MPPLRDLNFVRPHIEMMYLQGNTYKVILDSVNPILQRAEQNPIALSVLKAWIKRWGLSRELNPGLHASYDVIFELFDSGMRQEELLEHINTHLMAHDYPTTTLRTLQRFLQQHDITSLQRIEITESLIDLVRYYFYSFGYSDASIIRDLQVVHNIQTTPYIIQKIRRQYGMKRKVYSYEEREALMRTAIEFLERDLEMSSRIQDFGRGYLYHYVRQQGQILISQNRLYDFYRQRFPEQVARRREGTSSIVRTSQYPDRISCGVLMDMRS
jgi:hypothetical protein